MNIKSSANKCKGKKFEGQGNLSVKVLSYWSLKNCNIRKHGVLQYEQILFTMKLWQAKFSRKNNF